MLIDSLPGINSTKPEQLKRLQELEKQNQHTAQSLRETLSWAGNKSSRRRLRSTPRAVWSLAN